MGVGALVLGVFLACTKDNSGGAATPVTYAGPGSHYTVSSSGGTYTLNTGTSTNVACIAISNANSTGKQVLDCAGIDGAGNGLFNFLLVSR